MDHHPAGGERLERRAVKLDLPGLQGEGEQRAALPDEPQHIEEDLDPDAADGVGRAQHHSGAHDEAVALDDVHHHPVIAPLGHHEGAPVRGEPAQGAPFPEQGIRAAAGVERLGVVVHLDAERLLDLLLEVPLLCLPPRPLLSLRRAGELAREVARLEEVASVAQPPDLGHAPLPRDDRRRLRAQRLRRGSLRLRQLAERGLVELRQGLLGAPGGERRLRRRERQRGPCSASLGEPRLRVAKEPPRLGHPLQRAEVGCEQRARCLRVEQRRLAGAPERDDRIDARPRRPARELEPAQEIAGIAGAHLGAERLSEVEVGEQAIPPVRRAEEPPHVLHLLGLALGAQRGLHLARTPVDRLALGCGRGDRCPCEAGERRLRVPGGERGVGAGDEAGGLGAPLPLLGRAEHPSRGLALGPTREQERGFLLRLGVEPGGRERLELCLLRRARHGSGARDLHGELHDGRVRRVALLELVEVAKSPLGLCPRERPPGEHFAGRFARHTRYRHREHGAPRHRRRSSRDARRVRLDHQRVSARDGGYAAAVRGARRDRRAPEGLSRAG